MKRTFFLLALLLPLVLMGQGLNRSAGYRGAVAPRVTAGASSKTPDQVTGLAGWYKADIVAGSDGDTITTWTDSSGSGNDLTVRNGFTLKTAIQNGLKVARFNGTSQSIKNAGVNAGTPIAPPFTIFVVMKAFSAASGPVALWWAGGQLQVFPANVWDPQNPSDTTGPAANTSWTIMAFVINGASSKYRKDGGAWTSFSGSPGTANLSQFGVGAQDNAAFLQMDCAETFFFNTAVDTSSGGDGDLLFTGLNSKWAVY